MKSFPNPRAPHLGLGRMTPGAPPLRNVSVGNILSRRRFLRQAAAAAAGLRLPTSFAFAQLAGERPQRAGDVTVLNPRARVPVGLIIDDSTCLVNLNRFAMAQFD